jgi:hypothetical protein
MRSAAVPKNVRPIPIEPTVQVGKSTSPLLGRGILYEIKPVTQTAEQLPSSQEVDLLVISGNNYMPIKYDGSRRSSYLYP